MQFKHLLIPILMSTALVGCGGGGGGGSSSNDNTQTTANTEPATVSGSITKDTSTAAASVRRAAQTVNAQVQVLSYDKDGKTLDKITTVGNDDQTSEEIFSANVRLSKDGGYVIVRVYQDDFTSFEKRIDFDSPSDIDIQAELQAVTTLTAMPGTAITAGGHTYSAYQFAIMKQPDGTTTAVAGTDQVQIAKAAGSSTELEITVPANSAGVDPNKEMTAKLRNYDPSGPAQADNFPGKYEDESGNQLVSVAFDYASVSQDGENLGELAKSASGATAAATTPTIVRRAIPAESCDVLDSQQDSDSGTPGFNIPVYTYNPNSGQWVLLGQGTVEDGTPAPISNFDVNDCKNNGNWLKVEVQNDEFLHSWWNLDYPLTTSNPEPMCARVKVTNNQATHDPIAGTYIQIFDDSTAGDVGTGRSFQEKYAFTDANGEATLETVRLDGSSDTQAQLRFWGYGSGAYKTQPVTLKSGTAADCSSDTPVQLTVQRADVCKVTGNVVDGSGNALPDSVVWATAINTVHFATGYTDSQGHYSLNVICDADYDLWAGFTLLSAGSATFNVDGTVDTAAGETNDDHHTVTLDALSVTNYGPLIFAQPADVPTSVNTTTKINISGLDMEGDYPISYTLTFPNGSCQSTNEPDPSKCTGTITEAQANSGDPVVEYWKFSKTSANDGDSSPCTTTGTLSSKDSAGNVGGLFGMPTTDNVVAFVDPDSSTCGTIP